MFGALQSTFGELALLPKGGDALMPPPHLTLTNNQKLPQNPGKAPSVLADTSGYPNAPTRTCSRDFQVGFSVVAFTHGHCFIYQPMNVG
jgi:hypothetical protein